MKIVVYGFKPGMQKMPFCNWLSSRMKVPFFDASRIMHLMLREKEAISIQVESEELSKVCEELDDFLVVYRVE